MIHKVGRNEEQKYEASMRAGGSREFNISQNVAIKISLVYIKFALQLWNGFKKGSDAEKVGVGW